MFGLFNTNKVESLKKKSDNVVNVFTKTVVDLDNINAQIESEVGKRENIIAVLSGENRSFLETKAANNKIIDKLNSFFND